MECDYSLILSSDAIIANTCGLLKKRGLAELAEQLMLTIADISERNRGNFWHDGKNKFAYCDVTLRTPIHIIDEIRGALKETRSPLNVAFEDSLNAHGLTLVHRKITIRPEPAAITHDTFKGAKYTLWNGVPFRSKSEMRIAEVLDRYDILFFSNCRGRVGKSNKRETREPDFVLCYEGKWGILEVDGKEYHPLSKKDEELERDELFFSHGIKHIKHYDAEDCFNNPEKLVSSFLEYLKSDS